MKFNFLCEHGKSIIDLEEDRFQKADEEIRYLNPELANWLWSQRSISYERYWELAISFLRKTVWSDVKGKDMEDGTEVKTARFHQCKDGAFRATVSNLKNKTGAVVVVLFHPEYRDFDFLYIPADKVRQHTNQNGNGFCFTYPRNAEPSGWWVPYRTSLRNIIKA